MNIIRFTYTFFMALMATLTLTSCTDTLDSIFHTGEIDKGEKVQFTTMVPEIPALTRSMYEEWKKEVDSYMAVNREYTFNIEMWKQGDESATSSALYKPAAFADEDFANTVASHDGSLVSAEDEESSPVLYWQDNSNAWGFKATSVSSSNIESDQSNQKKWLYQDLLVGYSYMPLWDGTVDGDGQGKDNFDAINYRTSKQWYQDNKTAKQQTGEMIEEMSAEEFKKIPLYMKHQRSWITIILKAGDGVSRDKLAFENSQKTISTSIFSYSGDDVTEINLPWRNEVKVDYSDDRNGAAEANASSTRYDAIVNPHDYTAKPEQDIIARVNVSNQNFSFAAANDFKYTLSTKDDAEAKAHMESYKLEPGKHLTIIATLSRASRMVVITSWVEDWTEAVTTTLCDDYGQKGDPVVISSKQELLDFLNGEQNKAGYVGIISANQLDLDLNGTWNYTGDLNATLNVAGATLLTKNRLFNNIATSGSVINGIIKVKDGASPSSVIAATNKGTIERVIIETESEGSNAKATVAGFVETNNGTIYQCSSNLEVIGAVGTNYVGGIAAISDYVSSTDHTIMPVIDECTVNARVDGGADVKGGGIVGYANGRVSNCTFEYGITLLQMQKKTGEGQLADYNFKNIFNSAASETRAYNNSWPTKAKNPVPVSNPEASQLNENMYSKLYDQVIDQQEELEELLKVGYNIKGMEYRISGNFTVDASWNHAQNSGDAADLHTFSGDDCNGNMQFSLYGNNKTITLSSENAPEGKTVERWSGSKPSVGTKTTHSTGSMLFTNIHGKVYDLIIDLADNLISEPSTGENGTYNAADAMAPLGYSAYGEDALISNVRVISSANKSVESATPGGLVVWAYKGAKIENCIVDVEVNMWLPSSMGTQGRHYAGGIVACAAKAEITNCQYQLETTTTLKGVTSTAQNGLNCFYGGIVGGTAVKETTEGKETPLLALHDNSSWYSTSLLNNERMGSIIGFAAYISLDDNNTILSGMKEGNEGNWWNTNSQGAGYCASTTTEILAIGKRNSAQVSKR